MIIEKEKIKEKIGRYAAINFIEDDMIVGVGSGTTVRYFIEALANRIKEGLKITCVATSLDTSLRLKQRRIPVIPLNYVDEIDIAIDGADSVLTQTRVLVKGGGGAHFLEKIVDYAAKRLIIIVDETKLNKTFPVPADVYPPALNIVMRKIKEIGGTPKLREVKGKLPPCISDTGNIVIDIDFPMEMITEKLEKELNAIPGIIENGIFSRSCRIIVGKLTGEIEEINL